MLANKIPIEPIPPKDGEKRNDKSDILVPNAEIENGVINIETALASWAGSCDNYTYLVYRRQNSSSQYYDVNWSTNGSTFNEFNKMFYNISEAE